MTRRLLAAALALLLPAAAGAQTAPGASPVLERPVFNDPAWVRAQLGIGAGSGGGGATGPAGPAGAAAGFGTPTASGLPAGSQPTISSTGPDTAKVFSFGIPAGATGSTGGAGATGATGAAAGFGIPNASGLPAGAQPTVSSSGPDTAKIFSFGIPAGAPGAPGATGPAGPAGGSDSSSGPINGRTIGATTPASGAFTSLASPSLNITGPATGVTLPNGLVPGVSPQMYGAVCDGTTNDDTALHAWAAALSANRNGFLNGGQCNFTTPITFPVASNVSIQGASTTLMYKGTATTNTDFLTFGSSSPQLSSGCAINNLLVSDLNVRSTTAMGSGSTGVKVNDACSSTFRNVHVGKELNSDHNLNIALWFNGGNNIRLDGGGASGQLEDLRINGDLNNQMTDFWIDGGYLLNGGGIGLHIGGAVGGLNFASGDIADNNNEVLVDQAITAKPNIQVFFGSNVAIDQTNGGNNTGVLVNDAGGASGASQMFFEGTWIASAGQPAGSPATLVGNCVDVKPGSNWGINFSGGIIVNCNGAGILNESAQAQINVVGTTMWGNQNYAINNLGGGLVNVCGLTLSGVTPTSSGPNVPANYNGTITSTCGNGPPSAFNPSYGSSGGSGVASSTQGGTIRNEKKVYTILGFSFTTTYSAVPTSVVFALPSGVVCAGPNYFDAINGATGQFLVANCNNSNTVTVSSNNGPMFTASGQAIALSGQLVAQ